MLEFYTALTVLADFGVPDSEQLQINSELIEHKLNLLILLFTFRDQQTLNISEVIIMAKTSMNAMSKIYPEADLFQSKLIHEEIKNLMMDLFH